MEILVSLILVLYYDKWLNIEQLDRCCVSWNLGRNYCCIKTVEISRAVWRVCQRGNSARVIHEIAWKYYHQINRTLNHPNVVRYLGIFQHKERGMFIVTEFMSLGSVLLMVRYQAATMTHEDLLSMW
jgi:hypothetical protein